MVRGFYGRGVLDPPPSRGMTVVGEALAASLLHAQRDEPQQRRNASTAADVNAYDDDFGE